MKKILFIALAAITLAACNQDLGFNKPIVTPTEEKDPVTNDFTLIKACIGMSQTEAEALLVKNGYTVVKNNKYSKTVDGITKELTFDILNNLVGNVSLVARVNQFETGRTIFIDWMNDIRKSKVFPKIVRTSYELKASYETGIQSENTAEDLMAALNAIIPPANDFRYASFGGNDTYANTYSLTLFPDLGSVYLQVYNLRVGLPSEEFTRSDLQEKDLHRHILISKIDYMTFRNRGFYALNVTNKLEEGTEIPFLSGYFPPNDCGYIKLYYRYTENLLLDGTLLWGDCGKLSFPESFRAGLPLDEGLPFPGLDRIGFINNNGKYTSTTDETELRNIWQTLSKQKEFQHYFANSTKKVAVYLYQPSRGEANPYDAFYIVITEQTGEGQVVDPEPTGIEGWWSDDLYDVNDTTKTSRIVMLIAEDEILYKEYPRGVENRPSLSSALECEYEGSPEKGSIRIHNSYIKDVYPDTVTFDFTTGYTREGSFLTLDSFSYDGGVNSPFIKPLVMRFVEKYVYEH